MAKNKQTTELKSDGSIKLENPSIDPIVPFKVQEPEAPKFSLCADYHRNDLGLLQNVEYHFNEDKSVNWRKMIDRKYIVLNKEKRAEIESKYNRNFEELQTSIQTGLVDAEDIEDHFKLILLAGIKDLARLRGFTRVNHNVIVSSMELVSVQTTIDWIANYETNNEKVEFSSLADAHIHNTKGIFANVLHSIAENRGFVRSVRNFLGIHIMGHDELGAGTQETQETTKNYSPTSPKAAVVRKFEELRDNYKVSWETLRKHISSEKGREKEEFIEGSENWDNIDEVPNEKCYDLLGILGKIKERKDSK